ncbi:MAG: glycosyltransferase, partial [Thermodesulfobacteriota bacterium]|nr:glycosyltransferase [Thermodesulfobacteriota bacterium]
MKSALPTQPIKPIKILHLISTLDTGGAETSLFRLVTNMDKESFNNIVVSMTDIGPVGKEIQACGIPVYALKMKKGLPDPRGVWRLYRLIHQLRPAIIQCWMYHASILGILASAKRHIIWNIRCSDMDLGRYGHVYRWSIKLGALLSGYPDMIVANSHAGRITHESLGYHPKRWEVIPNGFDTGIFKPDPEARAHIRAALDIPKDAIVIGLVARLDPMKDHKNFFKAANVFLTSHAHVHFILAGKGVSINNPVAADLMGGIAKKDRFHLLGERDDIVCVFAALDIASSSSSYGEGFQNTIGEAMATGVPCVVTDVGDSKVIVGDTGIVVSKKDHGALAHGWDQLISAGLPAINKMGMAARERIVQFYTMNIVIER